MKKSYWQYNYYITVGTYNTNDYRVVYMCQKLATALKEFKRLTGKNYKGFAENGAGGLKYTLHDNK